MTETTFSPAKAGEIMEAVITRGDLAALDPNERGKYYVRVCESLGLNPMTRPFEYIMLNNRLVLYARKDATDQLRRLYKVSVTDLTETEHEGILVVTAKVALPDGRTDAAKGAVAIGGLKNDALANALMKAETKAKRRATLSICGLGFLDETELETIPEEAKRPSTALSVVTATKKEAKPIYSRMLNEIAAETSSRGLNEWKETNATRVGLFPTQWQMDLSLLYEEHMADLLAREAGEEAPAQSAHERWNERQSEQWAERQAGGLVRAAGAFREVAAVDAAIAAGEGKMIAVGEANAAKAGRARKDKTVDKTENFSGMVAASSKQPNPKTLSDCQPDGIPPFLRREANGVPPWQGMIGQAWGVE